MNINCHSVFDLKFHLVILTKYGHPVIVGDLKDYLIKETKRLFEENWGLEILEVNSDMDYIHIMFNSKPHINLANLVNSYKTVTSRLIRKNFSDELSNYYQKPYFWNGSYFISTVGDRSEYLIKNYIINQGK